MEPVFSPRKRYTVKEYFRIAEASPTKLEFRDGQITDMANPPEPDITGPTFDHHLIVANLIRHLGNRLDGSGRIVPGPGQRVAIPNGSTQVADVTILLEPPGFETNDDRQVITNPSADLGCFAACSCYRLERQVR